MSSTGGRFEGLPQLPRAPAVSSPRLWGDRVCIETVLAYRTKRGFRKHAVTEELQDAHGALSICQSRVMSRCGASQDKYLTEIWEKCALDMSRLPKAAKAMRVEACPATVASASGPSAQANRGPVGLGSSRPDS